MGAITPIGVTRMGEALFDREQAAADEAQYQREQRHQLVMQRAEEIHAKRCAEMSLDDMALAFELLSTYPVCLTSLREDMLKNDPAMAYALLSMIKATLMCESIGQANVEFSKLDEIKSGECH
jgi:hypothetical protein